MKKKDLFTPKEITFKGVDDLPYVAYSQGSMIINMTGSWKTVEPFYQDHTPPCNRGCPASENIARYINLALHGKYKEAHQLIKLENPLSGVCGRVCPHPCESVCNRMYLDEPIAIHHIERFVSEFPIDTPEIPERQNKRIAVIGAGPAGLSCSYQLALMGYEVDLYDREEEPGGVLRYGIPDYRLPKDVLRREIEYILSLGIRFFGKTSVESIEQLNKLRKDYDAVVLAIGLSKSRSMAIEGWGAKGCFVGVEFLKDINTNKRPSIGTKVAVIGGGNTAMDVARSAIRLGADVTLFYRRTKNEMPAIPAEVEEAIEEGLKIEFLTNPSRVLLDSNGNVRGLELVRMKLGEKDASGRARPIKIEGSEFEVECDTVISAIGEVPATNFLEGLLQLDGGYIVADGGNITTEKGIFACGDVSTGEGTVTAAIGSGKRAAFVVDAYLNEREIKFAERVTREDRTRVSDHVVKYEEIKAYYFKKAPRNREKTLNAEERTRTFKEVNQGLKEERLLNECARCFACGTCTECNNCLIFCPDNVIAIRSEGGYRIDYDHCKGCLVCVQECPRNAMESRRVEEQ